MPRVALLLCLILACGSVEAAERTVNATFTDLVQNVERALESTDLILTEFAQTERFAIFYIDRPEAGAVTVTLYTLPQQNGRATLTVHSDSPQDPLFDRRLLQSLLSQNEPEQ